ncbi:MAG TPA: bifunctional diaminohydroxyphosphoribosylaminopyrimidine deaminase/5-amino-6-(5-phosphoribosylamino)uracil reductase RibD [Allocoleopsis sp.]
MKISTFDQSIMQLCITLAQNALGKTAPNPLVGSVIVKNGQIIGQGFHPGAGQPHAEIFALKEAKENAKGATLYVNLEPCNHYGKTPPCTEAIILAGIERVVIGMIDPNPLVSGKGVERLKEAGIDVIIGVEENACKKLNEAFSYRIIKKRPFGILKYAMTLDGKIATDTGDSMWITNSNSRQEVHKLRASCDAIIIGGNTVRKDNPFLTTHQISDHNPLRVVMTQSLNLPENANLWDVSEAKTLVITEEGKNPDLQLKLRQKGVEVIEIIDLTPIKVMDLLYERGLLSVLWECGGNLAAKAIADGTIQKVYAFIAPKIIGGKNGFSPMGDLGLNNMNEALNLHDITWKNIGNDLLLEGYLS